jgi:hypothetical protein
MDELETLFGAIGLGLITLFIPYFLQVWKRITNWDDDKMLVTSLIVTYVLVNVYYVGTILLRDPEPTIPTVLFSILGMVIYPLLVWFGTQGIYTKIVSPVNRNTATPKNI